MPEVPEPEPVLTRARPDSTTLGDGAHDMDRIFMQNHGNWPLFEEPVPSPGPKRPKMRRNTQIIAPMSVVDEVPDIELQRHYSYTIANPHLVPTEYKRPRDPNKRFGALQFPSPPPRAATPGPIARNTPRELYWKF